MRRHSFDLTSLLAGLVFVAFAAVYLIAAAAGERVDAGWVLPVALVALGLAGLAGGLTRAVNGGGNANRESTADSAVEHPIDDAAS